MKIANLIRKRPREAVATAIPAIPATELGSRAASVAKIATVAVAKPDETWVEGTAPPVRATRWLIHYADREPLEVWFAPAAHHAETLAACKDAVAAEPIPERTDPRTATVIERDELLALVGAIYAADTDADRHEAIDAALADPAGALQCYRSIASERGITAAAMREVRTPVRNEVRTETAARGCSTCRHRKRPGRADPGYCGGGRDDLPLAYGAHHPLRRLPDDQGAKCTTYRPHED